MLTQKFPSNFPRSAGLTMGLGLCLSLITLTPKITHAEHNDYSYGQAQVTLGFPNAEVTVGHTWGSPPPPSTVIVEEVTHRYPQENRCERDCDHDWHKHGKKNKWKKHSRDRDDYHDRDDDDEKTVIIEKHIYQRPPPQVVIIEHPAPQPRCERNEVTQRVYIEPRRVHRIVHKPTTIIHHAPIVSHDHAGANYSSQNHQQYHPKNSQRNSPRLNPHGRRVAL